MKTFPKRIISLVPSITELLFDLKLGEKLIGRTNFCIHPADKISQIEQIGGPKTIDINKVIALKPDLIISVKEENNKAQIDLLSQQFNVLVLDIFNIESALTAIHIISEVCGVLTDGDSLLENIKQLLKQKTKFKLESVVYLIWYKPLMVVGKSTFIDNMLQHAGYTNLIEKKRYPVIEYQEIMNLNPQNIFLSSEPFLFKRTHLEEFRTLFPNSNVKFVDGEVFSWYGSRMVHSLQKIYNLEYLYE